MRILAEARGASARFGEFTAVSAVDLAVGNGEVVGLLGANGAGKTTLDEPTSGVGPLGGARLWEEIRHSADTGAGVLVTTHNMEEAQQCDRLVVMADGKMVAGGTVDDIVGGRTVTEVRCADPNRAFALLDAGRLPVQVHGKALRVGANADAVASLLSGGGVEAVTRTVPANLEEAFVAIVMKPADASQPGCCREADGGMSRTGRRPGTPETRDMILAVARRRFGARGYDATSLRGIATEAKVDPALVIHYFGSKEGLFVAATGLPEDLPGLFTSLAAVPVQDRVEALARGYLHLVDSDSSRNAIIALVRSAVSNEKAAAMLREFLTAELLPVIAEIADQPDARLRASLVGAQLIGIAVLRHVIQVEPLAKASPEEIVALVAPVIQQYVR